MIRTIFILLFSMLLFSCGASKSKKKSSSKKHKTTKTVTRKPAVRKPTAVVSKPNTTSSSSSSTSEVLTATSNVKVTTEIVNAYINSYKGIAQSNMREYGIPSSIIIAQGILESGSGTGTLCMNANNHFGIKCHTGWDGPSVKHDDDSEQECFRKYNHPAESYRDHALFLTGRARYNSLFSLKKDDYKAWARGLKNAGYATDPKYPDKLISLIERYRLDRYDAEVMDKNFNANDYASNDESYYEVVKGDTMYSISKKFNISIEELRIKNKIIDNAISIGQSLKIK